MPENKYVIETSSSTKAKRPGFPGCMLYSIKDWLHLELHEEGEGSHVFHRSLMPGFQQPSEKLWHWIKSVVDIPYAFTTEEALDILLEKSLFSPTKSYPNRLGWCKNGTSSQVDGDGTYEAKGGRPGIDVLQ